MAIDGTWRRSCVMRDVSAEGATLTTKTSIEGLNLSEFFLLLSTTGLAFRRCALAGVNGDELRIAFLLPGKKKARSISTDERSI
ncbi:PilZ domain-containing protein [Bradyrhizobium sp. NFR13]|uniref:PilZ domain-containing protein n=1 Tax=Bradyrhizobium sp. NFR13 TaxID=1566285 RepID=UPI0025701C4A|nr:PilZ domain-containing protein [Bradyrhizobium sp. NFR13]